MPTCRRERRPTFIIQTAAFPAITLLIHPREVSVSEKISPEGEIISDTECTTPDSGGKGQPDTAAFAMRISDLDAATRDSHNIVDHRQAQPLPFLPAVSTQAAFKQS